MSQGSGGGGGGYLAGGSGGNVLSGPHQNSCSAGNDNNSNSSGLINVTSNSRARTNFISENNSSCDYVVSVSNNSLTTGGCLTQATPPSASASQCGASALGGVSSGSTHDLTSGSVGELSPGDDGEDSNMSNNLASECMEMDSDDDEDDEDKANLMIYPWMKKIHVGGATPGKIRGTNFKCGARFSCKIFSCLPLRLLFVIALKLSKYI